MLNKMLSENFDRTILGEGSENGCGRGLVALHSLLTLKKSTRTLNFPWNEPLGSYYHNSFHTKSLGEKKLENK
jgi:hypothetical protein